MKKRKTFTWTPDQVKKLKSLYRDKQRWGMVELTYRINQEFDVKRNTRSVNQKVTSLIAEEELRGRDPGTNYATYEAVEAMAKIDGRKAGGNTLKIIDKGPDDNPGRKAAETRKKNSENGAKPRRKLKASGGPARQVVTIVNVARDKKRNKEFSEVLDGAISLGMTIIDLRALLEDAAA